MDTIKVTYVDGTEESFNANDYTISENEYPGQFVTLVKRTYEENGDYNSDDDEEVVVINSGHIRCIKF